MKKQRIGYLLLAIPAVIAVVGAFFLAPIQQSTAYHNFSDSSAILGIPNFWNVVSNLPFLLVGVAGVGSVYRLQNIAGAKTAYLLFFLGVAFVALGSGYYHWHPDDSRLVWDRLPMTIAFMALFSVVVSEFIHLRRGQLLLFPAIVIGLLSIVYWMMYNDLRMYAVVQFYPLVAMPITLLFFRSQYNLRIGYWLLFFAYILAKLCEHLDNQVHSLLVVVSGHTLKHLLAAIGIAALLYTYRKRRHSSSTDS